jgi:hypothetical protein
VFYLSRLCFEQPQFSLAVLSEPRASGNKRIQTAPCCNLQHDMVSLHAICSSQSHFIRGFLNVLHAGVCRRLKVKIKRTFRNCDSLTVRKNRTFGPGFAEQKTGHLPIDANWQICSNHRRAVTSPSLINEAPARLCLSRRRFFFLWGTPCMMTWTDRLDFGAGQGPTGFELSPLPVCLGNRRGAGREVIPFTVVDGDRLRPVLRFLTRIPASP